MSDCQCLRDLCTSSGTAEEVWHSIYGTTSVGNLPRHKAGRFVGKSYAPCPYSTQSLDLRTQHMLGLELTDFSTTKVDHTKNDTIYYMRVKYKGKWGYECTFDDCPYYLLTGARYFFA